MASKELTFLLYGRDKTASSAIKGVGTTGEQVSRKLGKAAVAIAAATAAAVAGILVSSVRAAAEAEKIAAQTDAVIKSTGAAAKRTAEQIGGLADQLAQMSGIDDELIQSGANILLTFTKIQGVNFDKATQATLDMSVALKTDMQSAAILVGKALNDPIKGVTALTRSGVQFTEEQKLVIRSLVETGRTAEAQGIILEELNTQFGGSAEAFGSTYEGTLGRFQVALGNMQEQIGQAFLPVLEELITFFSETLLPVIESEVIPAFENFAEWLGGDGTDAIKGFVDWFMEYKDILGPAAAAVVVLTIAQWGLNAAMTANPVGATIAGLTIIVGLITALVTNVGNVQGKLISVLYNIQKVMSDIVVGFAGTIQGFVNMIIDGINAVLGPLGMGKIGKVDFADQLRRNAKQGQYVLAAGAAGGVGAAVDAYNFSMGNALGFYGSAPVGTPMTGTSYSAPPKSLFLGGVPAFASGGIVRATPGGTLAIVGEGGRDEAVVPLPPGWRSGSGGGGDVTVVINNRGGSELLQFIDVALKRADGRMEDILVAGKVVR